LLRIYSKNAVHFENNGLCVLQNAYDVKIHQIINGEYTLEFSLPQHDSKLKYIEPFNYVKCENQLFRIKKINETTTKINVSCEHIFYDLAEVKYIPFIEWIGWTPQQILTEILEDTPFTLGTCEITRPTDLIMTKTNPMEVIVKLIENVGGELIKNNFTINLVTKCGNETDIKFKLNKNINSIKRETDASNVITRLYPYGEDDLDITTVNNGLHYLDSPLLSQYPLPKIGTEDFKDIKDPVELKNKALEKWSTSTKDGIDKPQVSYKCDVIELKKLGLTEEEFHIGDTITIEDEVLGINTAQRITDYSYYPYEAKKSNITLINYDPNDYITLKTVFANINNTTETINKMINAGGNVVATYVENIKQKLQTEVNTIVKKALLHNTPDMYVDNIDNPTKAILIGDGVFAIANSKKANGDWNWRTIATGDKVVADEVAANWVYAGGISADQITTGKLSADRIDATNLHVSSANIDGTITADAVKSDWVYAGGLSASQITTGKLSDSQINSASTWNGKTDSTQVVTIIGNTVNAPYINALNIQAASVASDWVYAGNISANQITSGSISANRISGGTLSGVILNVDTNATIGNELTIGSLTSNSVKSLNFHNSTSGVAKISYSSGGYLSLNAWGAVNITSPGGLVVNKLEVISPTATIYGKQIATLDDIENTAASMVVSDTPPTDHTKIWIDISNI
jgi:phage minor structural protein